MPSFALKVIRMSLAAVALFSPAAAGRLAFGIFSRTPGRRGKNAKEAAALEKAAPVVARAERVSLSLPLSGGAAVAHRFLPDATVANGKRVLVTHGWGSRVDYLTALVEGLVSAGAEVVALDWPGHGASPGRFLTMPQAVQTVDAAWRHFGPFDAAVGHSFGGASLACAAGGALAGVQPRIPGRLVLIGAPSEMAWLFADFGRFMRLRPKVQAAFEAVVERLAGRSLSEFDAARMMGALDVPVLIIHAEDDKEVAAEHARRYAAANARVHLHWANGLGHRRIVSAPPVIEIVCDFLFDRPDRAVA
ncbi:alpha/beta fold hydrolase [Pararhizobium antarcticum]|uniref:Hydrolase n=1 Tax=Pararhizobium antarcticum TaxID=1798805 RepID=A0A657LNU7_9HYPH|nr:alpha/beta fold hydrolase [Pararhizobium antarcticum]OJF93446.1 hydrolase [Pararhizobium antarcticum]OJG00451.1 hydrolase [Rhizobium sp. 58]